MDQLIQVVDSSHLTLLICHQNESELTTRSKHYLNPKNLRVERGSKVGVHGTCVSLVGNRPTNSSANYIISLKYFILNLTMKVQLFVHANTRIEHWSLCIEESMQYHLVVLNSSIYIGSMECFMVWRKEEAASFFPVWIRAYTSTRHSWYQGFFRDIFSASWMVRPCFGLTTNSCTRESWFPSTVSRDWMLLFSMTGCGKDFLAPSSHQ